MEQSWVVEIREQCLAAGVPFFFKQWGGANKKKAGRLLDGRTLECLSATLTAPQLAARFV
jgi:protein gp37